MSYDARLSRLELAKATRGPGRSRDALMRLAGLTPMEADGMPTSVLAAIARRRTDGEAWLLFGRDENFHLFLDEVRMPTKAGWRKATIAEFDYWRMAVERVLGKC